MLFNRNQSPLQPKCLEAVAGNQLVMAFMTRAELLLWPNTNSWGSNRTAALSKHIELYTCLYLDQGPCEIWSEIVGLVTADFGDYAAIPELAEIPIQ